MNMNANISVPAVNAVAAFANRASARALEPDIRKLFKRNTLDSLGCAIAARRDRWKPWAVNDPSATMSLRS